MGARLILYRVVQGELRKSARIAHILGPLAQDTALAPFPKLNWICGELIHAVSIGDFQQGLQVMAEGEAITREAGVRTTEGTILSMAFSSVELSEANAPVAGAIEIDTASRPI